MVMLTTRMSHLQRLLFNDMEMETVFHLEGTLSAEEADGTFRTDFAVACVHSKNAWGTRTLLANKSVLSTAIP